MLSQLTYVFKKGSFPLFVMVGMVNTLFGYSVFVLGIYCGLHYALASLIAFCLGIAFNFQTTGKIVFDSFDKRLIGKFILVYVLMYFLNISLLKAGSYFITNMYFNGLIVTVIMAVISFLLNKYIVFKK